MEEEKNRKQKKITDVKLAFEKMSSWCGYQERCQQEARDKLYEFGLWPEAVEEIIASLITENFINEERFAKAYVRGKFRIKKWGRIKIKMGLKQKRISDSCIKTGMQEIDGDEYLVTLGNLIENKKRLLKSEKNKIQLKFKLMKFAQSKGFETDLVMGVLKAGE